MLTIYGVSPPLLLKMQMMGLFRQVFSWSIHQQIWRKSCQQCGCRAAQFLSVDPWDPTGKLSSSNLMNGHWYFALACPHSYRCINCVHGLCVPVLRFSAPAWWLSPLIRSKNLGDSWLTPQDGGFGSETLLLEINSVLSRGAASGEPAACGTAVATTVFDQQRRKMWHH